MSFHRLSLYLHSPEKDESDTQLAVDHLPRMGVKKIIIAGATGGRLDHTFANIMLLASPVLKENRYKNSH